MSETHEIRLKIDAAAAQAGSREFQAAISAVKKAVKDLERDSLSAFQKLQAGINGTSSTKKISLPTLDKSVMKDLASYAKTQTEAAKAAQTTLKVTQGLLTALKGLGDAYSSAKRTTDGFNTAILKTNAALSKQIQLASLARSAVRQVRTAPLAPIERAPAPQPRATTQQPRASARTTDSQRNLVTELTALINTYAAVGAASAAAGRQQVAANAAAAASVKKTTNVVEKAGPPPAPPPDIRALADAALARYAANANAVKVPAPNITEPATKAAAEYESMARAAKASAQTQITANNAVAESARRAAEAVAASARMAAVAKTPLPTLHLTNPVRLPTLQLTNPVHVPSAAPKPPTAPDTSAKLTAGTSAADALAKALAAVIAKYAAVGAAGTGAGKRQSAAAQAATQSNTALAQAIAGVVAKFTAAGAAGTTAGQKTTSAAKAAADALRAQERAAQAAARTQEMQQRLMLASGETIRRAEVEAARLSDRLSHVGNTAGISAINAALSNLRTTLSGDVHSFNDLRSAIAHFNTETSAQKIALTQAEGAQRASARAAKELATQQRHAAMTAQQVEREMRSIAAASNAAHAAFAKTTGNMRGLENAFSMTFQAGSLFRNMLGSLTVGTLTKGIYEAGNALEQFRVTMTVAAGSTAAAQGEMQFLDTMTRQLGTDLGTARDNYSKFAISASLAGVQTATTRDIFESVSMALAVLGKGTEDQNLAFLALEQMMSKGTVSSEELRRQLGERLPGAVNLMAKALNVTTAELQDMLKAGEISSADALPKFAAEVRKAYGPGLQQATQRAAFNLGTLRGEITRLMEVVAESGFMQTLSQTFEKLTVALQSPEALDAAKKLGEGFAMFAEAAGNGLLYLIDNIDAVGQAIKGIAFAVIVRQIGLFSNAMVTAGLQGAALAEAFSTRRAMLAGTTAAFGANTGAVVTNTRALQGNALAMAASGAAGASAVTRVAATGGALTRLVGGLGLLSRAIGFLNPVVGIALTGLALWPLVMGDTASATEDMSNRLEEALRRAGVSMDEFAAKKDALSSGAMKLNTVSGDISTFSTSTTDFFDAENKRLGKYAAARKAVAAGTTTGINYYKQPATEAFESLGIADDALKNMSAHSRAVTENMLAMTIQTMHTRGSVLELRDAFASAMAADAGTKPVLEPLFNNLEQQARVEYALAKQKDSITELFGSDADRAMKSFVADAMNVIDTGSGFNDLRTQAAQLTKEFPKMATSVNGVMSDLGTAFKKGYSPFTFLINEQVRYTSVADDIVRKQANVRKSTEDVAKAYAAYGEARERIAATTSSILSNGNADYAPADVARQFATIPDTSVDIKKFKAEVLVEYGNLAPAQQKFKELDAIIQRVGGSLQYMGTGADTLAANLSAQIQKQLAVMPQYATGLQTILDDFEAFKDVEVKIPDLTLQFAQIPAATQDVRQFKDDVREAFTALPVAQRTFSNLDRIIAQTGSSAQYLGTNAQTLSLTLSGTLARSMGISGITAREMGARVEGLSRTFGLSQSAVNLWSKDIVTAAQKYETFNRVMGAAQGILSSAMSALSSLGSTALAQASGVNALTGAIRNLLNMANALPSASFNALIAEAGEAARVKAMDARGQAVYGKLQSPSVRSYFDDEAARAQTQLETGLANATSPQEKREVRRAFDANATRLRNEREQLEGAWSNWFNTADGSASASAGGGGGASAIEKLEDKIKNRVIALQSESVALREVASGTWQTEEAARLYAEALIRGNGVVDSNTVTMLRQMDAAAQLNKELEKLARDPVKEWLDAVPSWIEGARMIETGAIDGLSNALAEFFKTGEMDFAKFASDLAGQMADLLAKQAVGWGMGKLGIDSSMFDPTGAAIEASGSVAAAAMGTAITTASTQGASMFAAALTGAPIPAAIGGVGGVPEPTTTGTGTVAGTPATTNIFSGIQSQLSSMLSNVFGGNGVLSLLFNNLLSSIFGGLGGLGGGLLSIFGLSEGGYSDRPSLHSYSVAPSVFRNAPHFKNGTANTSGIPAILHDNEAVVPLTKGRKIPVDMSKNDPESSPSVTSMKFGDINIRVDHQGDLGDPTQLGVMATRLGELVETKIQEQLSVHSRYGGMLNPR
jgi:tape measure domain-containing protein